MSQWTREELQQALAAVARRATVDSDFRKLAIDNGMKAIAAINPKPLPADLDFRFVDNSGSTKVVALPDPISTSSEELSDAELAHAAGGTATSSIIKGGTVGLVSLPVAS